MSEQSAPPDEVKDERDGTVGDQAELSAELSEDAPVRVVDRRWWARDAAESSGDDRSDKPSYVEELETQLADKDRLLTDYASRYKTATREFEDTRVRLRKEVAKDVEREKRRVLTSFLDVIDNLERAIAASRDASDDNPGVVQLLQGVQMVRQQFLTTLASHGAQPIDADGARFDPNLHEAISVVPVDDTEREGLVIDVVKPGYQLDDEVLRPATVTVGKLSQEPE